MTQPLFQRVLALCTSLIVASLLAGPARAADKGLQATLDSATEAVQKAAADALTVIGCEIKKNDAGHLEGYRSHKVGLFVGSGGETVTVALSAAGDGKTSVDIRTQRTFVGGAGQKNWDQAVLDEIKKALAVAAPAAPEPAPQT